MKSLHWEQFKSMYKKDWLIRRRHYIVTFFELFLPIALIGVHLYSLPDPNRSPYPNSFASSSYLSESNVPQTINKLSAPRRLSSNVNDDYYYYNTFYCSIFGKSIFYTLPDESTPDFIRLTQEKCEVKTFPLAGDKEVIKAWGDAMENEYFSRENGLFFHELDPVLGIANYSIGGITLDYSGPWTDDEYVAFHDYLGVQSLINELLAFYPDYSKLVESDFFYDYTTKLFREGNPKSGSKIIDNQSDEEMEPISPVKVTDFYQGYTFIEVGFLYLSTVITRRVLREKITNSKELLRIMGLSDLIYWASNLINYFTLSVLPNLT